MSNLDLHIHSNYSDDADFSVQELFIQAKKTGLKLMAIADHDTVEANQEAIALAKAYDITYLAAIEVSCQYQGVDLHVLGYGITEPAPLFSARYQIMCKRLGGIFLQEVQKLNDYLHTTLDAKVLLAWNGGKVLPGERVCAYLLEDEKNKENPLLAPYFPGGARGDTPYINFYWDMMSQGKPAYVPDTDVTPLSEAITMIRKSGGFAVLAHPGQNLSGKEELLAGIVKEGIVGIEAYSSYHNTQQIAYYLKEAEQYDLLVTCGSDYHGQNKPHIHIGQHGAPFDAQAFLAQLQQRGLL